jgi:hypothetical protein
MATTGRLTRQDILAGDEYEQRRDEIRRRTMMLKDRRRVLVGDHCSVLFENRETLLYQVHEMLRVERSWNRPGAIEDELLAYDPLLPGGGDLSATVMFEYESADERARCLAELAGIEKHLWLVVGNESPIAARFDEAQIAADRISSVQFVRFSIDPFRRDLLREEGTVVRIVIDHPRYRAQSVLSEQARREIAQDVD